MRDYFGNLAKVAHGGTPIESRAGGTREWLGMKTLVTPQAMPRRPKMRRELGYMELCQLITGIYEPNLIARVAPKVDMALFGRSAVYGPRITPVRREVTPQSFQMWGRDQLADVIDELIATPNSRRAVITISAPEEPLTDQPCISSMQFLLRSGQLNVEVTARSWDLWFGAPHDLIVLAGIQQVVASCIGVHLGYICVSAGSCHIYERSIDDIEKFIENGPMSAWSFRLPDFGHLSAFRSWADGTAWDVNWLSGAPKGVLEYGFKSPRTDLEQAAV